MRRKTTPSKLGGSTAAASPPPSAVSTTLQIRGGDNTFLTNFMKFHRFLAAGLALFLIATPNLSDLNSDTKMPQSEVKLLQSWGGFVGFVAFCVHSALSFPADVQLQIGKGLLGLFSYEFVLYLHEYVTSANRLEPKLREAVLVYTMIFAMIMTGYAVGVYKAMK